jgi:thiamine biosynthesis lipoprotein
MNSDIELLCYGAGADRRLGRAAAWLAAYEERYSRFRVLSELSRLNAAAGRPFRASPGLFRFVRLTLDFARRSDGVFDPTVLRQLELAGYDRSFELITQAPARGPRTTPQKARWSDVKLDEASPRTITLPEGAGIDLGGVGKGWAVDRMASILGRPCLVNGGGDVFAGAKPPDDATWRVGVADPFSPERDLMVLRVVERGVATSSSMRRRWKAGDATLHHLIDPRTGGPSESDAVQVTVVAPSTLLADYHAKVGLILGAEAGLAYIEAQTDVEGVVVRSDGASFTSAGLQAYR